MAFNLDGVLDSECKHRTVNMCHACLRMMWIEKLTSIRDRILIDWVIVHKYSPDPEQDKYRFQEWWDECITPTGVLPPRYSEIKLPK